MIRSDGDYFFLTPEISAEYIERAAEICLTELDAVRAGRFAIDPMNYAYGN